MASSNVGQLLARVAGMFGGFGRRTLLSGYCQRAGCLLPVGSESEWGQGPVCMVCKQGLRVAAPPSTDRIEERSR